MHRLGASEVWGQTRLTYASTSEGIPACSRRQFRDSSESSRFR